MCAGHVIENALLSKQTSKQTNKQTNKQQTNQQTNQPTNKTELLSLFLYRLTITDSLFSVKFRGILTETVYAKALKEVESKMDNGPCVFYLAVLKFA